MVQVDGPERHCGGRAAFAEANVAYWLLKSEPAVFSLANLAAAPGQRTHWDGVRNYQARNWLRDSCKVGDSAFFYHSNAGEDTGIAGIMRVVREGYPDPSAFDVRDHHYDPKSDPAKPTWYCIDVEFERAFPRVLTLSTIKACPALGTMALVRPGNRLSVMPVSPAEWEAVLELVEAL